MHYSWIRLVLGLAVWIGGVALWVANTSRPGLPLTMLLLSSVLVAQPLEDQSRKETEAFSSPDREEWRKFGHELLEALHAVPIILFVTLLLLTGWNRMVRLYPYLEEMSKVFDVVLAPVAIGTALLVQAAVQRHGNQRRRHAS